VTAGRVDNRPTMAVTPVQLIRALDVIAADFADIHPCLTDALGRVMSKDGVMEFTVSALAKTAGVRLGQAKDYLRAARNSGVLHLLGRRTDDGKIRYCAYTITAAEVPA
jgi:hypothetical protein